MSFVNFYIYWVIYNKYERNFCEETSIYNDISFFCNFLLSLFIGQRKNRGCIKFLWFKLDES